MKRLYEEIEIEICMFSRDDIVVTSGGYDGGGKFGIGDEELSLDPLELDSLDLDKDE